MRIKITVLLLCLVNVLSAQTIQDEKVFEINTSQLKSFHLYNLNGAVNVKGIPGAKATLKVKRSLKSFSEEALSKDISTIKLDTANIEGNLYFFMAHPDLNFEIDENGFGHYNNCVDYPQRQIVKTDYRFDIEVEIPQNLPSFFSNHREDLKISDVRADLYARNHHDDLFTEGLGGNVTLRNHHGDITATFIKNPTQQCNYSTHHGDITIHYPADFSAELRFKSRHGEFFTDFNWESVPQVLALNDAHSGTKYKMESKTSIKINHGGPIQDFETYHGDVYVKKIK